MGRQRSSNESLAGLCGLLALTLVSLVANRSFAQGHDDTAEEALARKLFDQIHWSDGPATVKVGGISDLQLPTKYKFTGVEGTRLWNQLTHNPPDEQLVGALLSTDSQSLYWWASFSYLDIGHVPDDDQTTLDADAIFESIKADTAQGNNARRAQGWPELFVDNWVARPQYDLTTHNLIWAIRGHDSGNHPITNYNIRLLGRTGVMNVNLVVVPEHLSAAAQSLNSILTSFGFSDGQKYAEWKAGDKVAAYGLTGLITGGAVVAAAKSGLLSKLGTLLAAAGKFIYVGVIAVMAWIGRLFSRKAKAGTR